MFEEESAYRPYLRNFLLKKNKTLFAIYALRNESGINESMEAAEIRLQEKV